MSLRKTVPMAITTALVSTGSALTGSVLPTEAIASRYRPLPSEDAKRPQPVLERGISSARSTKPVTGRRLPYAHGRHFADLDTYLRYRREQSAIDLPWYEEVSPGLYALRTSGQTHPDTKHFTRTDLARQFGFDR